MRDSTKEAAAVDTKQADQREVAVEATQEQSACLHHWVVDPPAGRVSKGTCRSCGEERDFANYVEGRWSLPGSF